MYCYGANVRSLISALEERLDAPTAKGLAQAVSRAIRDGELAAGDQLHEPYRCCPHTPPPRAIKIRIIKKMVNMPSPFEVRSMIPFIVQRQFQLGMLAFTYI